MPTETNEDETPKPRRRKEEEQKKSRGPGSGDFLFFLVVFLIIVFVFVVSVEQVPDFLFNKYAGLIYLIMLVEYVVLKSMDRTRVYERENSRLREKIRNYRRIMQRSEKILLTNPECSTESDAVEDVEEWARWKALAEDCAQEIRQNL
ncbi:MAG: hypothetical protein ACFCU1_00970 [Sumerlaeia bacterium]